MQKLNKACRALGHAFTSISLTKQALNLLCNFLDEQRALACSKIPQKALSDIIDISTPIALQNFTLRNGNVSPFELMALASLIANKKPKRLLEIGTFDGNTTLQMALNSPSDAQIHTIDLPPIFEPTRLSIAKRDLQFIQDTQKLNRKYSASAVAYKVVQHLGDSTLYDFAPFGRIDFCFIDGGHTYECVKSDTEKVLQIMNVDGLIVWHDFTPGWPGVYRYLSELASSYRLIHIAESSLVLLFI